VGLFQPQAFGGGGLERRENTIMDQPFSFTNNASGGLANEGYNFNQPSRNAFSLPLQTSIPINGDRISMRIDQTQAQMAAQQGKTAIQTPYGTMFATEQQAINSQTPRTAAQSSSRTPQQQQELLAQMREKGGVIGKRLAGEERDRQQGLQRGYYSFRQGLEQDRFQNAMSQVQKSQARGESGRDAMRIAEQARYGGEIMRQAGANVGTKQRTPFFGEVASMPSGEKFSRGSMGEYSRVVGTGKQLGGVRGGPQPTQAQPMTMAPQFGRANTSQRSWDNYVGPNPIRSFSYSGGY
jgi:hypothetical protein